MGLIDSLRSLFVRRPPPEPVIPTLSPVLALRDDPESEAVPTTVQPAATQAGRNMLDLADITLGIEYVAADGSFSRRRVRLNQVVPHRQAGWMFMAWCLERRAPRQFRYDRIEAIFDLDGVVYRRDAYFRDVLGVDMTTRVITPGPALGPKERSTPPKRPASTS